MSTPRALPLFAKRKSRLGYAPAKAPAPKEISLHMSIASTLRRFARSEWMWTHFPAGELRDKATGAKLKAMGLAEGWPDFLLLAPGGALHVIEAKRIGEDLSASQQDFETWCKANGVTHFVVRTTDEALAVFERLACLRIKINGGAR